MPEGLTRYDMRSPESLNEEELRKYFVHLTCERKLARPTVTIALSGIKFFYEKTLKQDWSLTGVPTPKRKKNVPVVMSIGWHYWEHFRDPCVCGRGECVCGCVCDFRLFWMVSG